MWYQNKAQFNTNIILYTDKRNYYYFTFFTHKKINTLYYLFIIRFWIMASIKLNCTLKEKYLLKMCLDMKGYVKIRSAVFNALIRNITYMHTGINMNTHTQRDIYMCMYVFLICVNY